MATRKRTSKVNNKSKKSLSPMQIGKQVFIRCVTNYHTGRIVEITDTGVVLEDAAWIADTGRFSDALITGVFSEVEPFQGPVLVMTGPVVDATEWPHALPRLKK